MMNEKNAALAADAIAVRRPASRAVLGALAIVLGLVLLVAAAKAEDLPSFGLPIRCSLGTDCWVQNYVDHDSGPGAADFTCGHLTYDGHNGTDIRLADYAAMRRGVPVLAAAAGTVLRIREGMDDVNVDKIGRAALARQRRRQRCRDRPRRWLADIVHPPAQGQRNGQARRSRRCGAADRARRAFRFHRVSAPPLRGALSRT